MRLSERKGRNETSSRSWKWKEKEKTPVAFGVGLRSLWTRPIAAVPPFFFYLLAIRTRMSIKPLDTTSLSIYNHNNNHTIFCVYGKRGWWRNQIVCVNEGKHSNDCLSPPPSWLLSMIAFLAMKKILFHFWWQFKIEAHKRTEGRIESARCSFNERRIKIKIRRARLRISNREGKEKERKGLELRWMRWLYNILPHLLHSSQRIQPGLSAPLPRGVH